MQDITKATLTNLVSSAQRNGLDKEMKPNTESSQAADFVWEKMAEIYGEQWIRENGETPSLMWKAALNKKTVDEIKSGIAETVKQSIVWPPNLPKFVDLCDGSADASDSFDRFIGRKPAIDYSETLTRNKVGFRCRGQLPEDKARKLWGETIKRFKEKLASGEIKRPDPNAARIDTPEAMKKTLTPEQRSQQLDRQLDEMLKNGTRLIGPFNKRYQERLKEGKQQ